MFGYAKACFTATLVLTSSMNVGADDLALITIADEGQVGQAEVILGEAYGKVGDRFLVAVDTDKRNKLTAAGIDIEIVLSDADPFNTQLVLQPCSQTEVAGIHVDDLGRTVHLGDGVQLAQLSRVAASVLSSTSEYKLIPLEDHTVSFHYLPPPLPFLSFPLYLLPIYRHFLPVHKVSSPFPLLIPLCISWANSAYKLNRKRLLFLADNL